MDIFKEIISAGLVMGLLDFLWLHNASEPIYRPVLGDSLLTKPRALAAGLFYVIYLLGVWVLVINPAVSGHHNWLWTAGHGASLGFVAYATYDLTNWATLKKFTGHLVAIDMLWGTVLTTLVALAGWLVGR